MQPFLCTRLNFFFQYGLIPLQNLGCNTAQMGQFVSVGSRDVMSMGSLRRSRSSRVTTLSCSRQKTKSPTTKGEEATIRFARSRFFSIKGNLCEITAARWKRVCKWHGGKRTGARALEGRAQCTAAKTVHGEDSQAIRETSSAKMREMKELFNILPR